MTLRNHNLVGAAVRLAPFIGIAANAVGRIAASRLGKSTGSGGRARRPEQRPAAEVDPAAEPECRFAHLAGADLRGWQAGHEAAQAGTAVPAETFRAKVAIAADAIRRGAMRGGLLTEAEKEARSREARAQAREIAAKGRKLGTGAF